MMRLHFRPALSHCQRGVVYVEVLLAFFPMLIAFLGITQLALLYIGKVVVQHAANRAARAAVVVLEDDPKFYGDAPRGNLTAGAPEPSNSFLEFVGDVDATYGNLLGQEKVEVGARLDAIHQAAYFPLAVLAPPTSHILGTSANLANAVSSPYERIAMGYAVYSGAASSVTLHASEDDEEALSEVASDQPVTVRVRFLMPCGVPLVSRLMCVGGKAITRASLGLETSERAEATFEALKDSTSPMRRDLLFALGGSFMLIEAQATLPNQGANYYER